MRKTSGRKIRAVLFDLDNTLTDFMRVKRACVKASLDAMIAAGLRAERKRAESLLWRTYFKHGLEHQQIFQKFLKRLSGKRIDYKILAAGVLAYRRAKEGQITPYPSVLPTLRALRKKGLRLGIVTDAPSVQAWIRLITLGLENAFDFVIAFDDTRAKKPNQKPFALALERLSLPSSSVLFVGDSIDRDVAGAQKLGIRTAWARYGALGGGKRFGKKPDYVLRSFKDLLKIV